jgi:hypothetical protein
MNFLVARIWPALQVDEQSMAETHKGKSAMSNPHLRQGDWDMTRRLHDRANQVRLRANQPTKGKIRTGTRGGR